MDKKIIAFLIAVSVSGFSSCFAKDFSKDIISVINNSHVNKGCVSVSIKSLENKKTVFELNQTVPMPPASTQKIITTLPAIKTLGDDYNFQTCLYKDKSENYLIVLGADPYLKSSDLKALTKKMSAEVESVSIDDSVIDNKEWGEGWQWDDDINPLMPKFSVYNLDRNTVKFFLQPTVSGAIANLVMDKEYPMSIQNNVVTGNSISYNVEKVSCENSDSLKVTGEINKTVKITVPINNPKKYFKLRLADALIDNGKGNNGVYDTKKLDANYVLVDRICHSISCAKNDILKNSDNYVSETVFKLAGGKYKNTTGSFEAGKEMFNAYCKQVNLDNSQINIVDASGVSKNNLMVSDFMTEFLVINKNVLEPIMATSGEGTLEDRLLYLRGNLKAKTGTLSNVSALAGYVSSQNGHKFAFCIMINDSKSASKDKKLLEDNIVKTLYLKG